MRLRFGFLAAVLVSTALGADDVRPVTILHTNDLHARLQPLENGAGGFAYVAAAIRRERANCVACLLVNGGDLVQGSPVSTIFKGLPVFEIANLFGYDAGTIGNHDFDYGWLQTKRFVAAAKYPIVSANVVDDQGRLLTERPYVVLTAGGVRVAVIGALTEDLPILTTPAVRGPWRILPLVETLRRQIADARGRADLVVVLAHITEAEELKLLAELPEAPIIVTGHAHKGIPAPVVNSGRVVVRAKAYGEELGRLDLKIDVTKKAVESWKWKQIPIDSRSIAPAADVAAEVQRWEAKVSEVVDEPLAVAKHEFSKAELKRLIERAMREKTGADFAFMNQGGVRDILPEGQLRVRHIWNVMPFDNLVVVGRFKGRKLPRSVTGDAKVEPDREYTLAVSDFTAANQGAPSQLGVTGLEFPKEGVPMRDLIVEWVRGQKVLE